MAADWTAIFNFLLVAGAIQGFVFNVGTFLSRRRIEPTVLFLNLFVFFLSLNNLQAWLQDKGFLDHGYYLSHLNIPWYVFVVPTYYAFLVHYLGVAKTRYPYLKLTLAVFILECLARGIVLEGIRQGRWESSLLDRYNIVEDLTTLAYSLYLYAKAYRLLFAAPGAFPQTKGLDNLRWLRRLMRIGALLLVCWGVAIFLNGLYTWAGPPYSYYPLRLGTSLLIYWVGYQAFFRYVLLQDRLALRRLTPDGSVQVTWPAPQAPDPDRGLEEFERLDAYVKQEKRYQDPLLSQEQLARDLNLGTSTVSRLVNGHAGKNFADYVNTYRIALARQMLAREDFSAYTITAIGLECGFNSKSTFYAAFKKMMDCTPTEYRKRRAAS